MMYSIPQQLKDSRNGIAMHVKKTANTNNWQEAKILGKEDNWGRRRVLEALVIQQRRPMMNLQDAGLIFGSIVDPFVHPGSGSHMTRSAMSGGPTVI